MWRRRHPPLYRFGQSDIPTRRGRSCYDERAGRLAERISGALSPPYAAEVPDAPR